MDHRSSIFFPFGHYHCFHWLIMSTDARFWNLIPYTYTRGFIWPSLPLVSACTRQQWTGNVGSTWSDNHCSRSNMPIVQIVKTIILWNMPNPGCCVLPVQKFELVQNSAQALLWAYGLYQACSVIHDLQFCVTHLGFCLNVDCGCKSGVNQNLQWVCILDSWSHTEGLQNMSDLGSK
jgi:hypothetical protein